MGGHGFKLSIHCLLLGMLAAATSAVAEDCLQWKYDRRHSGDPRDRSVGRPLGLVGAVPLGDAILTATVVADRRIYAVDSSGTAYCIDTHTLAVIGKRATLGAEVYAIDVDGTLRWTWNFVRQVLEFPGDRWSGSDGLRYKKGRVTWRDQFCAPVDLAVDFIDLASGAKLVSTGPPLEPRECVGGSFLTDDYFILSRPAGCRSARAAPRSRSA
jgi:hypothetical protein